MRARTDLWEPRGGNALGPPGPPRARERDVLEIEVPGNEHVEFGSATVKVAMKLGIRHTPPVNFTLHRDPCPQRILLGTTSRAGLHAS